MSAKRVFVLGMARTLDLFGTTYAHNRQTTPRRRFSASDSAAIRSDWMTVGRDLSRSIESFAKRV